MSPHLLSQRAEFNRRWPNGIETLRQSIAELENRVAAATPTGAAQSPDGTALMDAAHMEKLAGDLEALEREIQEQVNSKQLQIDKLEARINGTTVGGFASRKTHTDSQEQATASLGLRQEESQAKEAFTRRNEAAKIYLEALNKLPTAQELDQIVLAAEKALADAKTDLQQARLTDDEQTIEDRLRAAKDGLAAIQGQLTKTKEEFDQLTGELRQAEGLHQARATAAVRVMDLDRLVERETLEKDAVDRLYELFEECREKQLGAIMGPIHQRVLRWMRLLGITGYQTMHFNDQFLPEKLTTKDGATEYALHEESTGTIEQIALLVRLALGSTLSTQEEPVTALLDDPLTHSDTVRMDYMRAVLRNAAAGDAPLKPPVGPLQVIIFTCHPEWFRTEDARIIDLSQPSVLTRRP